MNETTVRLTRNQIVSYCRADLSLMKDAKRIARIQSELARKLEAMAWKVIAGGDVPGREPESLTAAKYASMFPNGNRLQGSLYTGRLIVRDRGT